MQWLRNDNVQPQFGLLYRWNRTWLWSTTYWAALPLGESTNPSFYAKFIEKFATEIPISLSGTRLRELSDNRADTLLRNRLLSFRGFPELRETHPVVAVPMPTILLRWKLATYYEFAMAGAIALFMFGQDEEEKSMGMTIKHNGRGFNAQDGGIFDGRTINHYRRMLQGDTTRFGFDTYPEPKGIQKYHGQLRELLPSLISLSRPEDFGTAKCMLPHLEVQHA